MRSQPTHTKTYMKLVEGTTINTQTLLSTDYLNHFNELIMMLNMVPDMPEMFDEAKMWVPKTYQEHFKDSVFTHKDLAIFAYEHAPDEYRVPLDEIIKTLNAKIKEGLSKLDILIENNDPELLRIESNSLSIAFQELMDRASAIINGVEVEELDTGEMIHDDEAETNVMAQNAIDDLFN